MTDPTDNPSTEHAAVRLRLYTDLLPNYTLGEIAYDEGFRSEEWPRAAYHPSRPDLVAVLDGLDGYGEEILRLRDHNDANCEAVAERNRLREQLARVDEEIAEFVEAAEGDPDTPAACLHMIELLRRARTKETTS